MRIVICGGGNIAHSLAVVLGERDEVAVLTRRPNLWKSHLLCSKAGFPFVRSANAITATSDPAIVSKADIIIVAVPKFAIDEVLRLIRPFHLQGQTLVFAPAPCGLESIVDQYRDECGVDIVGLQRVPYISRIVEYGKSVSISADRKVHKIVVSNSAKRNFWAEFISRRFGGRVVFLSSFFTFSFSNANSLLHPARLFVLLKRERYERMPLFYEEWTDESSELYVAADREMYGVMRHYPQIDLSKDYESGLAHYDSMTTEQLTAKIRSIPSFKGIASPYKEDSDGCFVPDFSSRYFTEDIPFGTECIRRLAERVNVDTPIIDMLVSGILTAYCQKVNLH